MKNLNKLRPSTWIIFICLQILTLNISAQYCIPQHSFPMLDVIIDGVELGDIMNTGSGVAEENIGYSDYTELSTGLIAGSTNTIYLENKSWQYNYSVWIDFNQNMEFEETEKLGTIVLTGVQSGNITINIPADAINGETRMRVRAVHEPFGPWMNSNDPCLPFLQGDTEDYTVLISGGIEHDLSIKKLISPVSAVELNEESITIAISNHTDTDFSDVNVAYTIDAGPEVVEIIPDVIPANSDFIYTFSEPANLTGLGCYSIALEVQHPDDGLPLNDNLETAICNLNYVSGSNKWLIHSNIDGGAEALSGAPYFNSTNSRIIKIRACLGGKPSKHASNTRQNSPLCNDCSGSVQLAGRSWTCQKPLPLNKASMPLSSSSSSLNKLETKTIRCFCRRVSAILFFRMANTHVFNADRPPNELTFFIAPTKASCTASSAR